MTVSVVIPTTGTWDHLWRLRLVLESLTDQLEDPLEIMVVDAAGEGQWVESVCREFLHRLPIQWRQLPKSDKFRAGEARNLGVKELSQKPDRILFLDNDCVTHNQVVKVHAGFHDCYIVAGARLHVDPTGFDDFTVHEVHQAEQRPDKRLKHPENWHSFECCYTCHLSIGYELFNKVGGFWDRMVFGEDREMSMRAVRAGGHVVFLPELSVFHIDHPIQRPTKPSELGPEERMLKDSLSLPGFLRD